MNRNKLIGIFDKHNPNTAMGQDETMFMMNAMLSDDKNFSCPIDMMDEDSGLTSHFKPLIESFVAQVFLKRIEALTTLKMSIGALVILMHHMESPGSAVMYAYHLRNKLPKETVVTAEKLGVVFPWGFFSETQLKEIWDAQKVGVDDREGYTCIGAPDNMIDYLEMWKDK
jgi:hypothetical protein